MQNRTDVRRAGVALVAVAGVVAGCGSASGKTSNGGLAGAGPSSRGSSAASAPAVANAAALTKLQVQEALPDQHAMGGWERVSAYVGTPYCSSGEPCKGKWSGNIKYRLGSGTMVTFKMITFGSAPDADEYYRSQSARFSRYAPIQLSKIGDDSFSYMRNAGGLDGAYVTTKAGTVVATVFVERGGFEATLPQTATMFVTRIRQAEAGQTPNATLPQE